MGDTVVSYSVFCYLPPHNDTFTMLVTAQSQVAGTTPPGIPFWLSGSDSVSRTRHAGPVVVL